MNTSRKSAALVGILFIIGTVAGILSAVVTGSILKDSAVLQKVAANQNQIIIASLLVLIMGFALAMVPVVLFPFLKKHNEAVALGAVVFRGVLESVGYIAIAISWLLLVTVSQAYLAATTPAASSFQPLGALLLGAEYWITQILAIVFSLGALMIYYLFYRSRLIPRWLSVWGLIGAVMYLVVPLFKMFGILLDVLMAPLALQEMVLALWLILKGFNLPDIQPKINSKAQLS